MDSSEDTFSPPTNSLYLKATELRLGLPGSESPKRDTTDIPQKHHLFGKWVFSGSPGSDTGLVIGSGSTKDLVEEKKFTQAAPASKAQVVGWPPIRSFRKNTMASNPAKVNHDKEVQMYVKVRMDGAPYMRKVDLKTYGSYTELSSALKNMFSCFTHGLCVSLGVHDQDGLSESQQIDLMHGSNFLLIYEDKDGDWMLVGDVPWKMFTETCRRLRITKSSEAIGLAPRAMEKLLKEE